VIAFGVVAALVLIDVAVHEVRYASDRPFSYGPAKVIAWGAGGSALLAVAVVLMAIGLKPRDDGS